MTSKTQTIEIDDTNDLDLQWAAVQAGEATVPHDEVVRWLSNWRTSDFRSWREVNCN